MHLVMPPKSHKAIDEAAEHAKLILELRDLTKRIEQAAKNAFESLTIPMKNLRRVNEHLMDAKKSIIAAVANCGKDNTEK